MSDELLALKDTVARQAGYVRDLESKFTYMQNYIHQLEFERKAWKSDLEVARASNRSITDQKVKLSKQLLSLKMMNAELSNKASALEYELIEKDSEIMMLQCEANQPVNSVDIETQTPMMVDADYWKARCVELSEELNEKNEEIECMKCLMDSQEDIQSSIPKSSSDATTFTEEIYRGFYGSPFLEVPSASFDESLASSDSSCSEDDCSYDPKVTHDEAQLYSEKEVAHLVIQCVKFLITAFIWHTGKSSQSIVKAAHFLPQKFVEPLPLEPIPVVSQDVNTVYNSPKFVWESVPEEELRIPLSRHSGLRQRIFEAATMIAKFGAAFIDHRW